jgi:hypothetical protein
MGKVTVILEGKTKEEIDQKVESYLRNYHPAGYGTHIKNPVEQSNGEYVATGYRWSSCD